MSRQLRMQVRVGDESAKPEESAIVAVDGEPDLAMASAPFDDSATTTYWRSTGSMRAAAGSRRRHARC